MIASMTSTLVAMTALFSSALASSNLYPASPYKPSSFNTASNRPWYQPTLYEERTQALSLNYSPPNWTSPSPIAMCLDCLDFSSGYPMIVNASVKDINATNITAALTSGRNSVMHTAGTSWIELSRFPFMQSGVYDLARPAGSGGDLTPLPTNNSRRIDFLKPYAQPPKVLVFFKALDMDASTADYNLRTYVTDVDARGFTVHLDAEGGSALLAAAVTWLALPADLPGVQGGTFSTTESRSDTNPSGWNSNIVRFERKFKETPSGVFIGLNQFHIGRQSNMRLRNYSVGLSQETMQWVIESWADSINYSSGGTWLAWE